MKTGTATFLTLLLGVAIIRDETHADDTNQSEASVPGIQPMGSQESRGIDTPEVVLQLKYDGGALNRIYLAQFRKGQREWQHSVPSRTNLCADLCSAGLGGEACGSTCQELVPIGLQSALQDSANSSEAYPGGEPRTSVCPTLCNFQLGEPLCNCGSEQGSEVVDWAAVCNAFCVSDRYVLGGCPSCDTTSVQSRVQIASGGRVLATTEGWGAWCGVQCRQGHGGAACNCDKAPFL